MISLLLRLGLIFFFPRILKSIVAIVKNRNQLQKYVRISTIKNRRDILLCLIPLSYAAYLFCRLSGVLQEPNYFRETSTPLGSPAFMVRNHYRAFMQNIRQSKAQVDEYLSSLNPEVSLLDITEVDPNFKEAHDYLRRYELLSRELKGNENKSIYTTFGEEAFMECDLCDRKIPLDYVLFKIPGIGFSYVFFCISLGLICLPPSKRKILFMGALVASAVLAYEGVNLYMFTLKSDLILIESNLLFDEFMTKCEKISIIRHLTFFVCLILGFLIELPGFPDSRVEALQRITTVLRSSVDKLTWSRLSKAIIFNDEFLKKPYSEVIRGKSSKILCAFSSSDNNNQ